MAQEKGQALTPSQREVSFKGQWLWLPVFSILSPGDRHTHALKCTYMHMCPETGIWYNSELVPGGLKAASAQRRVVLPDKQVSRRNREGCFSALCFLNLNLPL